MSHRTSLPQLDGDLFLTDGGIETSLIFHQGLDLPEFAAFVLLDDDEGLDQLRRREAWFAERRAATLRSDAQSLMAPTETWSMFVREWSLSP